MRVGILNATLGGNPVFGFLRHAEEEVKFSPLSQPDTPKYSVPLSVQNRAYKYYCQELPCDTPGVTQKY